MGFILCWIRVHQSILHSWLNSRVHLVLWQCSWGLSGVLSRKLRLLTCLFRNTILLCTKCREIRPSFESSFSRYIPLETESTESLSPTYCWGKTPLDVLVENWLTSSVRGRESALILRWYVVHGTFFMLLCWNEYSYRLEAGVSDNLCSFLKEVNPLVPYSVEHGIAMEPMKGKCASSWVDLGYTELFCIP